MKAVMKSRLPDFFDRDNSSLHGFLQDIVCVPGKYELMRYVLFWENSSLFPSYRKWKSIVNNQLFRMHDSQLQAVSLEVPNVKLVLSAFASMNPNFYWSLRSRLRIEVQPTENDLTWLYKNGDISVVITCR